MVWVIAFGELFFGDLWCVVWGYGGMRTHFSLLNPHLTRILFLDSPKNSLVEDHKGVSVERMTGLEPATLTLARLCATSCATSANTLAHKGLRGARYWD